MSTTAFRDKWILITGGASGIGLETACAFAERGARLILTDLNPEALDAARARIQGLGVECETHVCDVTDLAAVNALAQVLQARIGALDVLINNAGTVFLGGFMETQPATWQRVLDVNVMGAVNVVRAFLPAMQARPGVRRIVNVASLAGMLPAPNMAAYAASKHAVIGFSEVLAMELAASPTAGEVGILVVCPGVINTPLLNIRARGANISDRQLATLQTYYQQHGCHPREVAEDIVAQVWSRQPYLFSGPQARLGYLLTRLSRRLARWFSLRAARENGYLEPR